MEHLSRRIMNGELDQHLDALIVLINNRRKLARTAQAYALAATLDVGDRVKLAANVRPKYLAGIEGTVTSVLGTKAMVLFDESMRRYGESAMVPLTIISKVS